MTFFAQVGKADSLVVSVSSLSEQQAAKFPSDADTSLVEITEAEFAKANREGTTHEGSNIPRWRWDGTEFVSNPDTRPVITFTPSEIKAEVGDVASVSVGFRNITGQHEFVLAGVPVRVDFVNGEATVLIDTDNPGVLVVGSQQDFRAPSPLRVTVFARKIG